MAVMDILFVLFTADNDVTNGCQAGCSLCHTNGQGKCDGIDYCDPVQWGGGFDGSGLLCTGI